ncbi:MAG TPA: zinc-dependent metalloprotease, partial [Vicinamibacteria bacterium]|nr:zinc-dependent metalloprotease [Vicinamibacteria bacterium]
RVPFEPVPRPRQEAALALLRERLFSPRAFAVPPELLNKLASERWPDWRDPRFAQQRYDYPLHEQVLQLQRQVLDRLMHPIVLSRLLDGEVASLDALRIGTLFAALGDAIWEETLAKGASLEINSHRRALQREHLQRIAGLLLRGEKGPPEDARTQARRTLQTLRERIRGAMARPRMPEETRAHLEESLSRIEEALKAGVERQAL